MIKIGDRYVQSDPRQREYDRFWNENPPHWDGPVERAAKEAEKAKAAKRSKKGIAVQKDKAK